MAITVDQLRSFDSNWGNLVVEQDAKTASEKVKAGGLRHALASLFHMTSAQDRNRATYNAIRDAIMMDERFFAPEVQEKATELLDGLANASRIKASAIKSIISQLDAMSTVEKQIDAVKESAIGHLAVTGIPRNIPASLHNKYKELAADFATFRSDPKTSMASIRVDQRVDEFNQMMERMFNIFRDSPVLINTLCKTLSDYTPGGDTFSLRPEDKIQGFSDKLRENVQELGEIHNSRGRAISASVAVMLERTGILRQGVMTAIVDTGANLPKCGLGELNGQSGAGAIHRAVSKMAEAMDKARSELDHSVTDGIDPGELGACLVKSAMVQLPQAARRNLLAALETNAGKNLLGFYAQHSDDPKAQRMSLVYSSLVAHLKAEFNGDDPGAAVQTPAVDMAALPPDALCEFSLDDVIGGAEAQTLKDSVIKGSSLEQAANPVAELKKRMGTVANAKVFMQIVDGMTTSLFEKQGEKLVYNLDKVDTSFKRDVTRDHAGFITIHLDDGTVIAPTSLKDGRDALLRLITGDPDAEYTADMDVALKRKVNILTSLLHQSCGEIVTASVGISFSPEDPLPHLLCSQGESDSGARVQTFVVSKDDNGAITINYNLHYNSPSVQTFDGVEILGRHTDGTSAADYSLSVTIPKDNLETLSKCDWEHFGLVSDLTAKEAGTAADRFETLQKDVPKEFRFTGDVSLSFSLRANQLIRP